MTKFRFQDFEIWQMAIEIADELFDIADDLEKRKLYRFADQLRGAGMSMSNNIAEGAGSNFNKEFSQFLNIARRSTFENANIVILLNKRGLITNEKLEPLLDQLDHLCRKITNFQKTLK
jgi:four helix bundle protein